MNERMQNWDDLRLFLAVARAGGLAGAQASTGKSAPTLGRRMLALERQLGQDLFHRLPKGYELTPDGRALLTRVEALEDQIAPMARDSGSKGARLVKISAGRWMTRFLCDGAAEIMRGRHPVILRFISADHVMDIARREAVIGIRNARPDHPALAGRRLGQVRFALFGADPSLPWARVTGPTPSAAWSAAHVGQDPIIEVTDPRNALDLARAGAAKAVLPTFVGALAGVSRLSDDIPELTHDQWLVTHHEDRHDPPVRQTLERIATRLKAFQN